MYGLVFQVHAILTVVEKRACFDYARHCFSSTNRRTMNSGCSTVPLASRSRNMGGKVGAISLSRSFGAVVEEVSGKRRSETKSFNAGFVE